MSEGKSLKRNSQEMGTTENEAASSEPQAKIAKTDGEAAEPNLQNSVAEATDVVSLDDSSDIIVIDETSIEESNATIDLPPETAEDLVDEASITEESGDKLQLPAQTSTTIEGVIDEESSAKIDLPPETSITIKFHDKSLTELYKPQFLKFLNSFVEFTIKSEDDCIEVLRDASLTVNESAEVELTETIANETPSPSKKRKKRSRIKKELFVLDVTPSPQAPRHDLRYTTKFTINTEKGEESAEKPSRQTCFNCDQFHALKDCPLPRDYNKINAARQRFKQQPKSSRYHLEEEQKFSHLKPGRVSNELRKALGLHKNEAPHYIYLMRQLGYPPGWLEEAKFLHSNLDMFDIDGNHVKTSGAKKQGLDPRKIVDYPGFNMPFEKGIKDEFKKYEVPPYSENFSKDAMLKFYNEKFAKEEDNLETCDMDIDHEQDSLVHSQEMKKDIEPENRDSPSLIDLEQKKRQLLEELNDQAKKETSKDFLAVKTSCFGTPILKSTSSYATLPDPDNFSKDVSPVINFENLPNSTGKYEQMTDVLQKVRTTLKKINSCNV